MDWEAHVSTEGPREGTADAVSVTTDSRALGALTAAFAWRNIRFTTWCQPSPEEVNGESSPPARVTPTSRYRFLLLPPQKRTALPVRCVWFWSWTASVR